MVNIIFAIIFFVIAFTPTFVMLCLDENKHKKRIKKEYDDEKNYWKDKYDELLNNQKSLISF